MKNLVLICYIGEGSCASVGGYSENEGVGDGVCE
jgi:hypothetical protein